MTRARDSNEVSAPAVSSLHAPRMRLKSNPVRERPANGAVVTGISVFTGGRVVELAAAAGLDFVVVLGTDAIRS